MSYDHHDEETLGKPYDARLVRRLMTYVRPYSRFVVLAVIMLVEIFLIVGPGNFGAHLQNDGELGYRVALPYPEEGLSTDPPGEPVSSPWVSPWRLIVVSNCMPGSPQTQVASAIIFMRSRAW